MNNSGIYMIRNSANDKIYIGSSVNLKRRLRTHQLSLKRGAHDNPYLQKEFNKYGEEKFNYSILIFCCKDNLIMYEQLLIDSFKTTVRQLVYNLRAIAESNLGIKFSDEAIANMKNGRKGIKLSPEHRANIGKAGIGNKYNLGRVYTEEEKKKRSESMIKVRARNNWSTSKKITVQ